MKFKRFLVVLLEDACDVLDRVPWLPWPVTRLRCPHGLALWSSELDEKWGTGVWEPVERPQD